VVEPSGKLQDSSDTYNRDSPVSSPSNQPQTQTARGF
jgi:hypothetical protein